MSNDKLEALLEAQYKVANELAIALSHSARTTAARDHATAFAVVVDKIISVERLLAAQHCENCGIKQ